MLILNEAAWAEDGRIADALCALLEACDESGVPLTKDAIAEMASAAATAFLDEDAGGEGRIKRMGAAVGAGFSKDERTEEQKKKDAERVRQQVRERVAAIMSAHRK